MQPDEQAEPPVAGSAAEPVLLTLPDELLVLVFTELDAAAFCRLSQVDKAMQQWNLLHAKERVYAWRYARAWLVLCDYAKARVQHRWASIRGRHSVVWNHFTSVGGSLNRVYVRAAAATRALQMATLVMCYSM